MFIQPLTANKPKLRINPMVADRATAVETRHHHPGAGSNVPPPSTNLKKSPAPPKKIGDLLASSHCSMAMLSTPNRIIHINPLSFFLNCFEHNYNDNNEWMKESTLAMAVRRPVLLVATWWTIKVQHHIYWSYIKELIICGSLKKKCNNNNNNNNNFAICNT